MAELTPAESFFDFDAASGNDLMNEVGSEKPKALKLFSDSIDQHPQPRSTMNSQSIQQAGQRAAISVPSPALAPLPVPDMQQEWPVPSPMSQNIGTGQFTYRETTTPYQPTLQQHQQKQQVRPQLYVQQQRPAPAPASQSMRPIHSTCQQPPAHGELHARMFQRRCNPFFKGKNLEPRRYIHQRLSASVSPNSQQQYAPLPPNAMHQKLRPTHRLQQPGDLPTGSQHLQQPGDFLTAPRHLQQPGGFPTGPRHLWATHAREPAQGFHPTPPAIQQHQQNTAYGPLLSPSTQKWQHPAPTTTQRQGTSPLPNPPKAPPPNKNLAKNTTATTATANNNHETPIKGKGSKPTGITKKPARPAGRKPKDHDKVGFINTTIPPSEHFDITRYGRESLRGAGSAARLAQPWNRPSVKADNGSKAKPESDRSQPASSAVRTVAAPTSQAPVAPRSDGRQEEAAEEEGVVVNEGEEGAEAPVVETGRSEQGPEMTANDEDVLNLNLGGADLEALFDPGDGFAF